MIEAVRGKLVSVDDGRVVIEAGGVSLSLQAPAGVCDALGRLQLNLADPPEVRLSAHLLIRPDSWQLFGFRDAGERDVFRVLLGIPGIGPRLALSLLSHLTWDQMCEAVAANDAQRFQSVPGIGKRTAARVVVELSGKIERREVIGGPPPGSPQADAADALVALGVGRAEAAALVRAEAAASDVPLETAALVASALRRRTAAN